MNALRPLIILSLVAFSASACDPAGSGNRTATKPATDWAGGKADGQTATVVPMLPHPQGQGALAPWGGPDQSAWRPEAILANAASAALNEAWLDPQTADAIVAIPTLIQGSTFSPFPDGQTNAAASFAHWGSPRPPLVATCVERTDGSRALWLRLDRDLPMASQSVILEWSRDGAFDASTTIAVVEDAQGDRRARTELPVDLDTEALFAVRPEGWNDAFSVHCEHPSGSIAALEASVPDDMAALADGRDVVDPLELAALSPSQAPFDALNEMELPDFYNAEPFETSQVHGAYPNGSDFVTTAVGRAWTWLTEQPSAPFKNLYVCFEERRPDLEVAPDGGVPSGAGWHRIGDPAETVLNNVEAAPIAVAFARGTLPAQTPNGAFPYGLLDVATFRWLAPGEAFTVGAPDYHWYFIHHDRPVCTQIWVHPCTPPRLAGPTFACG